MMTDYRRYSADVISVALLTLLCVVFFWRLLTPFYEHRFSLTQGDFSGQFVAFGGYQYARMSQGEIPLWNPYNNGGLPFIADTQAAVFYPPRLLTIVLSTIAGTGWTYRALELEMVAHVWLYTLAMYALMRRMLLGYSGIRYPEVFASWVAAVVGGYGGYMTGYPPLQLALLEAGVWLPLAVLGILEATRPEKGLRWWWLVLTGWALGMSWLAGHPQTSWFLTYLLLAYYAYRVAVRRHRWWVFVAGAGLFGAVSVGVVAVTLFPGLEYLLNTSRSDMGFAEKGGGFPYRDFVQILFPGVVSLWSPLYVGIVGLALVGVAVIRRIPDVFFWLGVALFALGLSVGANGLLYPLLYPILPGLSFFRGQERAAYLYAHALAILAGYGMMGFAYFSDSEYSMAIRRGLQHLADQIVPPVQLWLRVLFLTLVLITAGLGVLYGTSAPLTVALFSVVMAGLALVFIPTMLRYHPVASLIVFVLVVFELFAVNINNSNYDPLPADQQLIRSSLLDIPLADDDLPFRVDGFRGVHDNYGSLYGLADIQGISPLFLTGVQEIIEYGLPDERAWELFAVRYVYSDWSALVVPWELVAQGTDRYGDVNLFRLTAPRPYAHLVYDFLLAENDTHARAILADPAFDARNMAILARAPSLILPYPAPEGAGTTITHYAPESFTVIVNTPENAILSLAHVDYNGWYATIDGEPVEIIRAYGGLMALEVPAGIRTVTLTFDSLTYRIGATVSLFTWGALMIMGVVFVVRRRTGAEEKDTHAHG